MRLVVSISALCHFFSSSWILGSLLQLISNKRLPLTSGISYLGWVISAYYGVSPGLSRT
ncbi:hypothetical protein HMPREF0578_0301 [Mobiluncus mulieris 28-1]|nr:hypothetical protein HMPREF0578_0301 [Mobiluncus mulieris 28-1]